MRKQLSLALCLLVLLSLLGCGSRGDPTLELLQPVRFYYRTAQTDFSAEDGVIRAELRDLGTARYSDLELFRLYFQGPQSKELVSPISHDTELTAVSRSGGILELRLTRDANSPAEFDHALTYACLAKTGLDLEGVRKVRILVNSRGGALEADVLLSESDLLLYDKGVAPENLELNLYFADEEGRFLLTEKRSVPYLDPTELPQYVLEQLSAPPQTGGMRSALPPGTAVLDVSLQNGVCAVDFNGDFYANRPETEQEEALTVLSVVNTLCELEGINQVQIYVEGRKLEQYRWLDLSNPWLLDSAVVGPVREELNEFAGTLCLPGRLDGLLHRLTVRCRAGSGLSRWEALAALLMQRASQNGLLNPLTEGRILSVSLENSVCALNLSAGVLPKDPGSRRLAIRALTATLCSLPEIQALTLLEEGAPLSPGPMTPEAAWFAAE